MEGESGIPAQYGEPGWPWQRNLTSCTSQATLDTSRYIQYGQYHSRLTLLASISPSLPPQPSLAISCSTL